MFFVIKNCILFIILLLCLLVNVEIKLFFGWFTMHIKDLLLCELYIEKRAGGTCHVEVWFCHIPNCRVIMNHVMPAIRLSFSWNIFTCVFKTRVFATNRKGGGKYANYRLVSYFVKAQWVTPMRRFFVSNVNPFLCQKHAYWRPICMPLCNKVILVGSQYVISNTASWW